MAFDESIKEQVLAALQDIPNSVEVSLISGSSNSKECLEVEGLLEDIAEIIPKVKINKYDIKDSFATENNIERVPGIMIHAPGQVSSYVYYGLPAMYEFSSLIEAIRTVGNRQTDLSDHLKTEIKSITKPLTVEIYVTPRCSFCPAMVVAGFRIAYENPNIKVKIIETTSFRDLMVSKGVRAVPKVFINDNEGTIDGSIPIDQFVAKLKSM